MSLPLDRVGLEPGLVERLAAKRMHTARDVLVCPELDLMEMGFTQREIATLLSAVAQAVLQPPLTVRHCCGKLCDSATALVAGCRL